MFKQFSKAVKAYGTAFNIIVNNNLWSYFLFPVIIFILLFIGGTAIIEQVTDLLHKTVMGWLNLPVPGTKEEKIFTGFLDFFVNISLKIIFFIVYSTIIKYLILIFLSPVLALLSERVDEIITGKKYEFSLVQLLKDALRGSMIALRNMFIQLGLVICCFILMMIPVIGWFAPFFLAIINYYFYGFTFLDYTSERYRLSVSESTDFVRRNKGLAIGNGFIFAILFAIPWLGVIIAPILAVVAATVVATEPHTLQDQKHG
jgi:CysZ protein